MKLKKSAMNENSVKKLIEIENHSIMKNRQPAAKKTFWIASLFYFLIAFEFIYMASPFAIYFYAAYGTGLDFLNASPVLAWLCRMFLPHIVQETSNGLLNAHNVIGWSLFTVGLLSFCFSAVQIYYYKLTHKTAVTSGLYRFIRHPQYASFIICGLGLLILWPRYISLLSFLLMLFVYYSLAKIEERECEKIFGEIYTAYKSKTQMFLPIRIAAIKNINVPPSSKLCRGLSAIGLFILTSILAIGLGNLFENISIDSLYAKFNKEAAYISVSKIEQIKLVQLIKIAHTNPEVQKMLTIRHGKKFKFINYILPVSWYVPEIPMNKVYEGTDHFMPYNYDKNVYKIVFTKAVILNKQDVEGKEILFSAVKRIPVIEVIVDLSKNSVTRIANPPVKYEYMNIPVPIY